MLDHALQRLPCEIEAGEIGVTDLEFCDDAERLHIVVEPAVILHAVVKHLLAGMAEGWMAEVMGERHSLSQIIVQTEGLGDGPGDLRHLQRVCQARAIIVAFMRYEDLSLLLQAAKSGGVYHPIPVAGEGGAGGALALRVEPPQRHCGVFGPGEAIWRGQATVPKDGAGFHRAGGSLI